MDIGSGSQALGQHVVAAGGFAEVGVTGTQTTRLADFINRRAGCVSTADRQKTPVFRGEEICQLHLVDDQTRQDDARSVPEWLVYWMRIANNASPAMAISGILTSLLRVGLISWPPNERGAPIANLHLNIVRCRMHGLYVERRSLNGHGSLSWDLAHHMYARSLCGKIAVVTDKPRELLSATRKQWMRIYRQGLNEQASTLNTPRVLELIHILASMQSVAFSAKSPDDLSEADVTFATADNFRKDTANLPNSVPHLCF